MKTKNCIHRWIRILVIGVFALSNLSTAGTVFAGRHNNDWQRDETLHIRPDKRGTQKHDARVDREGRKAGNQKHREAAIPVRAKTTVRKPLKPAFHKPVKIATRPVAGRHSIRFLGNRYSFTRGRFYRQRPLGRFVAVPAPLGIVVTSLPWGYSEIVIGGSHYFTYGGIYYRRIPSGYMVTEPPVTNIVIYNQERLQKMEGAETLSSQGEVVVTAAGLNLRLGPGLQHRAIDQVQRGDILEVIGEADGWLYVQLPSGKFGWVMRQFTDPANPPAKG